MTLLERRRAMMKRAETEEHWDYILLPDANGLMTRTDAIAIPANATITIAWDSTGFDGATGRYIYRTNLNDAFFSGTYYHFEHQLPTTIGQMVFKIKNAANFYFGGYSGTPTSRFMGAYLKIRIR